MSQSIAVEPQLEITPSQAYRDWLGVGASVLCAIHCAAMPFVVGFLPLLGLSFLADPSFHKWMVGICLALALLAFVPGWRRHHRLAPTIIGLGGLGLITFAAFAGPEDCCPTPCATTTPSETSLMTVAGPDEVACVAACCDPEPTNATLVTNEGGTEEACAASCCSTDAEAPNATTEVVAIVTADAPQEDLESTCVAACCATETTTPTTVTTVAMVTVTEEASCSAGCCPEEDDTIVTAGLGGFLGGDFMDTIWLIMTPIGGVILVAAHLTNHRLSAGCKAGCCTPADDAQTRA